MATCKSCGQSYNIMTASLGAGVCNPCLKEEKKKRAQRELEQQKASVLAGRIAAESEVRERSAGKPPQGWRDVRARDSIAVAEASHSPAPSNIATALIRRYSDAYSTAHYVTIVGKGIKVVAIVLGVLSVLIGFAAGASQIGIAGGVVLGVVGACMFGIPIYILGILIAAIGQMQLATLDTAVNSSRHLSDDDDARVLAKKFSA